MRWFSPSDTEGAGRAVVAQGEGAELILLCAMWRAELLQKKSEPDTDLARLPA